MKFENELTRMLGVRYPIIQGAFGNVGTSDLAAPVSEAGGLGVITSICYPTPEDFRTDLQRTRDMTAKPFAVNFSPTMDIKLLDMLAVAIEEKVPIIETAGSRAVEYGRRIKDAGLIWIHKVQTQRHALAAERDGADAICIMGLEGAGLKNPAVLPTMVTIAAVN